jgi:hypothetical protein
MTACWKITYPGGVGYTNDNNFSQFVEESIRKGRIASNEWAVEECSFKRSYAGEDGEPIARVNKKMSANSLVTKGGE